MSGKRLQAGIRICTFLLAGIFVLGGCEGKAMGTREQTFPALRNVPQETWDKLAEKKIFFGHQSVGANIIEGIEDLMKEHPEIRLNIAETRDPAQFGGPVFAHSKVGKNRDPKSKLDDFKRIVEQGVGAKADIAFLKFCYLDVSPETNVDEVFQEYRETLSRLEKEYPETLFVHFSVPIVAKESFRRNLYKRVRGKTIRDYPNNANREKLSELLRKEYAGRKPFFDIAEIESTDEEGVSRMLEERGAALRVMVNQYTDDGAHPNALGRKRIAEKLLLYLAVLAEQAGTGRGEAPGGKGLSE